MCISFVIALSFIMMGIAIRVFKWYFLISGYNTMSKEKKDKVDIEGLARFMGMYLYANGAAFLAAGILQDIGIKAGVTAAWVFFAFQRFIFWLGRKNLTAIYTTKTASCARVLGSSWL